MSELLSQLDLNKSFFAELVIFAFLFIVLSQIYFKPFLKLLLLREQKTRQEQDQASLLLIEAQGKLEEYRQKISEVRKKIQQDHEQALTEMKKSQFEVLSQTREKIKIMLQEAHQQGVEQYTSLKENMGEQLEPLAKEIVEKLLLRKQ